MDKQKVITTGAYYAAFVAMGISQASLGPTLPGLAQNVGVNLGLISILFTARAVGSLLISFFSGWAYNRLRGHLVMGVMIALMAVFTGLTPFMQSFGWLVVLLFLTGAVQGLLNIGANTFLVWLHGDAVGPLMNGLHFFFGLGTLITPILVAQLIMTRGGLTWSYVIMAGLIAPTLLVTMISGPVVPAAGAAQRNGKLDYPLILWLGLIFACYGGIANAFGGWIFTYVLKLGLGDATLSAYLNALFWGGLVAGRLLAIPLAMRLKSQTMLWIDLLGALASLVLMSFSPKSLSSVLIGTALLGFFIASIYPTTMAMAGRLMAINSKITGMFSIGSSIGMMLMPWIVGQLFVSIGPASLMVSLMVPAVIAMAVLIVLALRYTAREGDTVLDAP